MSRRFYKPKWDGEKWVEGLTAEEIEAIQSVEPPLSELEILRLEMAESSTEYFEIMLALSRGE